MADVSEGNLARGGLQHAAVLVTPDMQRESRFWRAVLEGPDRGLEPQGFWEGPVAGALARSNEPALRARERLRACSGWEPPGAEHAPFRPRCLLESTDAPNGKDPRAARPE